MSTIRNGILAAAMICSLATTASSQVLNAESPNAGSDANQIVTLFAKYANGADVSIRVNAGQTATKSVINVASGKTTFAVSLPPIEGAFSRGIAMYEKIGDKAKALSPNLRSVFGWTGGVSMLMAYESSGIEGWGDLRGKRVYLGPPGGNATRNHIQTIKLTAGLEPEKDYTPVYMGFQEGRDALTDGLVDAGFVMGSVQSARNQLMLKNKPGRVIGFSDDDLKNPATKKYLSNFGTVLVDLPAGTYEMQTNKADQVLRGFTQNLITHKDADEEMVYQTTKAFWENYDQTVAVSAVMANAVKKDDPIVGISTPLHPGALRYYQEIGIDVPDRLIAK